MGLLGYKKRPILLYRHYEHDANGDNSEWRREYETIKAAIKTRARMTELDIPGFTPEEDFAVIKTSIDGCTVAFYSDRWLWSVVAEVSRDQQTKKVIALLNDIGFRS